MKQSLELKASILPSLEELMKLNDSHPLFDEIDLKELSKITTIKNFKDEGSDEEYKSWVNATSFEEVEL